MREIRQETQKRLLFQLFLTLAKGTGCGHFNKNISNTITSVISSPAVRFSGGSVGNALHLLVVLTDQADT